MHSSTLTLSSADTLHLAKAVRLPTSTQRASLRAQIILLAADGVPLRAISRQLQCRPATVRKWTRRWAAKGMDGLDDAPRTGRPRTITPEQRCCVIALACSRPEENGFPGVTEWSSRLLASRMVTTGEVVSLSARSVARILARASIKPHRCDYWKRSSDPLFAEKMHPIIDLYLNPPSNGPVWCVDEKTSIQALQRRYPDLPLRKPGELSKREVEYIRHGTRCLTAGFEVATGRVIGLVTPNRPATVFVDFLDYLDAEVPSGQVIHVVADNLNTHRGKEVAAWQEAHPGRLEMHFLPFYASWLNQVEMWFATLTKRLLRRGDFTSLDCLEAQIHMFIKTHNLTFAHPYRWTYTGEPLAA